MNCLKIQLCNEPFNVLKVKLGIVSTRDIFQNKTSQGERKLPFNGKITNAVFKGYSGKYSGHIHYISSWMIH